MRRLIREQLLRGLRGLPILGEKFRSPTPSWAMEPLARPGTAGRPNLLSGFDQGQLTPQSTYVPLLGRPQQARIHAHFLCVISLLLRALCSLTSLLLHSRTASASANCTTLCTSKSRSRSSSRLINGINSIRGPFSKQLRLQLAGRRAAALPTLYPQSPSITSSRSLPFYSSAHSESFLRQFQYVNCAVLELRNFPTGIRHIPKHWNKKFRF